MGKGFYLNTLMYTDNLVIIQQNENYCQRELFSLSKILTDYHNIIFLSKIKIMAFLQQTINSKQKLSYRTYNRRGIRCQLSSCNITCTDDKETESKISHFQVLCTKINIKETQFKYYNVLTMPQLLMVVRIGLQLCLGQLVGGLSS